LNVYLTYIRKGCEAVSEKRVAIVTGGTRGIGQAVSFALAKQGCVVFSIYHSNERMARETETELKQYSPESEAYRADVSIKAEVDRLVGYVVEKQGRVDILVNNAGIFDFSFIEDMSEEMLDRFFAVNFKSQFFMSQACIAPMKKQKYGRIINASSISATIADVGLVAYGISKASINMFTKIAAAELAPYQITVNAYAPGITHTDLTDEMIRERGTEQAKQIALNRFGSCEEVAALVSFLASEQASYITGEVIGVDGGFFKVQNPYRAHQEK
jgi:3-oxoacyl-[acyl-carrier protein] reductase